MGTISKPKKVRVFMSQYPDFYTPYWMLVKETLEERGIEILDERQSCDVAVVLNAVMFNPSAFKNKMGFIFSNPNAGPETWDYWVRYAYAPVLEKYFNPLEDLFYNNIGESADRIMECMNEIN